MQTTANSQAANGYHSREQLEGDSFEDEFEDENRANQYAKIFGR